MRVWIFLAAAIGFEVLGTSLLRVSDGFAKWQYAGLAVVAYWASFWFLAQVLTKIPMGVAYAIWSGLGIVLISVIGWLAFSQMLKPVQIGFIAMILIGAIGLNLTTSTQTLESGTGAASDKG